MKKVLYSYHSFLLVLGIILIPWCSSYASSILNSFKPGKDWKDADGKIIDCHAGNIIYQEATKTYFWFGEHRGSPRGVSCYSSTDLYNWKKRGVVLKTSDVGGGFIERPKVAYNAKTNKYVMWVHYDSTNYRLAHQGVAVCDSAAGTYKFLKHFMPNGNQSRDIGMFSDDDGKTYIGYAANRGASINAEVRMVELSDDYLSVTTNDVITGAHCEGPSVLKWNNKYYLLTSLCTGWDPNEASYYTGNKVCGTYTKIGSPCIPTSEKKTFNSQPSSILKVPGFTNGFIYIGDRWNGAGSTKSQYVFLPIIMTIDGKMQLKWHDEWSLDIFTPITVNLAKPSDFRTFIYQNAINKSTIHGYNLLGRSFPYFLQDYSKKTATNINLRKTQDGIARSIILVP